uniref:protein-serine/threonine phosphatase n=1 Tax=Oryza brachyantha TaxID=4533 RepID=J3MLB6_ORYBR
MSSSQQLEVGEGEESGLDEELRKQAVRETGRGSASPAGRKVTFGFHLVEGKTPHGMEDRHVAEFRRLEDGNEVGLFAVFDGHAGADVATYLREHLFDDILREPGFWTDTVDAIRRTYHRTDRRVLEMTEEEGDGEERRRRNAGSTADVGAGAGTEFVVLASDGLWKVMSNQECVDAVRGTADARKAAAELVGEALERGSADDIACVVVRLH